MRDVAVADEGRRPLRDHVVAAAPRVDVTFLAEEPDVRVGLTELIDTGLERLHDGAPSNTVAAVLTNDRASLELLVAAIVGGVRLVSLPLPPRGGSPEQYAASLDTMRLTHGADAILARDDLASALGAAGVPARPHSHSAGAPWAAPGSAFELVQFSSGTTGPPTGVVLGEHHLDRNVIAILAGIDATAEDVAVSWLPLSHDMGLVGMVLGAIVKAAPDVAGAGRLVLLDPTQFLRDPRRWSDAVYEYGGSISAMPDFGLQVAGRRGLTPGTDLSTLRCLIVGGEIVRPATLEAFERATGIGRTALCPAYGMAEVGLAVTIDRPTAPWSGVTVSALDALAGRWSPQRDASDRLDVTWCGTPLEGYRVWTEHPDESEAGPAIGRLVVDGPSIGTASPSGMSLPRPLRTSDMGVVTDAGLAVLGRVDDVLVVRGRNISAPSVEHAASAVDGVRAGRCAALVDHRGAFVVLVETTAPTPPTGLSDRVRRAVVLVAGCAPDLVLAVDRGTIPFTPSGKLRRAAVRQLPELTR